jgi:aryl-alcohol dehydrogenase-like predicted oxidoreductase
MYEKIILGTANFNNLYGFRKKKFKNLDLKKILELNSKIRNSIDTAIAYKNSSLILKKYSYCNQKIYSKLPCIFKNNINKKNFENKFKNHLQLMNVNKIFSFSFHNAKNLNSKRGYEIYNEILKLKKKKIISKIGVSLNSPEEIKLLKNYKFDLIQIPLNIFDQRFIEKKIINYLQKNNIKLQIRSIFLQGSLLEKKTPIKLLKFDDSFNNFRNFCRRYDETQLFHCINFIKTIKLVDGIVVGVENLNQFEEIIKIFKLRKKKIDYSSLKNNIKELIMPPKWKK